MALVGISIGLMFAIALVAAPPLTAAIGLSGLFGLTCALALAGIVLVIWVVPPEPAQYQTAQRAPLSAVWRHADLLRLNAGVFTLHTVQMAMWVAVPAMLVQAGLHKDAHWQVYLPAVVLSVVAMGGVFAMERRGRLRAALLLAIGLLLLVQLALALLSASAAQPSLALLGLLFVFFAASMRWRRPSPAWSRAWPRTTCAAQRWGCTTPCSRSACSSAARSAVPWPNGRVRPGCLLPPRCWWRCGCW